MRVVLIETVYNAAMLKYSGEYASLNGAPK